MKKLTIISLFFSLALPALAQDYSSGFRRRSVAGGYPSELIAVWELEESSDTRVDAHGTSCGGSGCDLTDNNTVTQSTSCVVGNCAAFASGSSEYLSHADHADISLGSDTDFTIITWIYLTSTSGDQTFIAKASSFSSAAIEYLIRHQGSASTAQAYIADGTTSTNVSAGTASAATWYYVVSTHSSADDDFCVSVDDATPVCNTSWSAGTQDTAGELAIGRFVSSWYMNGRIDQVALYIGAVANSTYITCMYNSGSGRSYADMTTCGTDITADAGFTPESIVPRLHLAKNERRDEEVLLGK